MREPIRKKERERRALGEPDDVFVTAKKLDSMRRELKQLKTKDRLVLAAEVARTAAMGDFSETAAYQTAKQQLQRALTRIITLEDKIARAIIIQKHGGTDIQIGSTITLVRDNGESATYIILGVAESNPSHGAISHLSPLGAALIGKQVGDRVEVGLANNRCVYTVKNID